jgi:hypothetical protein
VLTATTSGLLPAPPTDTPEKPPWPVGGVMLVHAPVVVLSFQTAPLLAPFGPIASE